MVDVEWGMKQLHQVYHSEDHLKLALGAKLAQMYGENLVRHEWKPSPDVTVDIGVRREDVTIPIELKYKTDAAEIEDSVFEETFELKRHGAHDANHYLLFRDVRRIEQIVEEQGRYGYVVLLTNDSNYWTEPSGNALYDEFRVHEGEIREGKLQWPEIKGWMKDDVLAEPIKLAGEYVMEWTDFTYNDEIDASGSSEFRYLVMRVD